jgi:hypothetical protein
VSKRYTPTAVARWACHRQFKLVNNKAQQGGVVGPLPAGQAKRADN